MRKTVILSLLAIATFSLQAQAEYKKTKYPNGNIKMEGYFENGNPVGEIKRYHENGKLQGIQFFEADGKSKTEIYAGDGTLSARGIYDGHKKIGVWSYYASSGYLFMLENYVDGLRQGEALVFAADSTVLERMFYVDGLLNGERISYYPYGNVMYKYTYEYGVLNGLYQFFFESGSIGEEGMYKNGKREGVWKIYDVESPQVQEINYVDGVADNQAELDAKLQEKLDSYEVDPKILDPEDYIHNPEAYFGRL
jgi:antitoxin component YwqK of YwqJK toxin-antitoxin module